MLQKNLETKLNSNWNILQIYPTDTLGVYRLWLVLDTGQISSIFVEIPRVIYANSYRPQDQNDSKKLVKKRLPRETTGHYLYEITISEQEYHRDYSNFDLYLTNPELEGIYETKLPLDVKFITTIGNQARVVIQPQSNSMNKSSNNNNKPGNKTSNVSSFQNGIKVPYQMIQGNFNASHQYLSLSSSAMQQHKFMNKMKEDSNFPTEITVFDTVL